MEQLYYLYPYAKDECQYEHHISIVTKQTALKAAVAYLEDVEDWRFFISPTIKTKAEFSKKEPGNIVLTFEEDKNFLERCRYSLHPVDMTYIKQGE